MFQSFFVDSIVNSFFCVFPEFFLLTMVIVLIVFAVITPPQKKSYLLIQIIRYINLTFFFILIFYMLLLSLPIFATSKLTLLFCYQTLKLNQVLIYCKIMVIFFGLLALFQLRRYLSLYQLTGYEYPLLIAIAVWSILIMLSANNWLLLFLALELQALCFVVLFAWNRRCEKAINASLKFVVINFMASTLILLAFIEIILHTQSFIMPLITVVVLYKEATQWLWQFVGLLLALGFAIKLGLVPFGFWLQDLFGAVTLPVLNFFSTAPKFTYIILVLSFYHDIFGHLNAIYFLQPFIFLGGLSILVANLVLFTIKNNLLNVIAWSSIANIGLLFWLFGICPQITLVIGFIMYYLIGTWFFMCLLQYIIVRDQKSLHHPLYFSDLTVLRGSLSYYSLVVLVIFSLLNFFGIPPLAGFWSKFLVFKGLVTTLTIDNGWWFLILLFISLIGSFIYLRIFYSFLVENINLKLNLVYFPATFDFLNITHTEWLTLFFVGYQVVLVIYLPILLLLVIILICSFYLICKLKNLGGSCFFSGFKRLQAL